MRDAAEMTASTGGPSSVNGEQFSSGGGTTASWRHGGRFMVRPDRDRVHFNKRRGRQGKQQFRMPDTTVSGHQTILAKHLVACGS